MHEQVDPPVRRVIIRRLQQVVDQNVHAVELGTRALERLAGNLRQEEGTKAD